jgi:hypothetical protein
MKKALIYHIIILAVLILSGLFIFGYDYLLNYQYEKVIGSYMDNAKDMNTPDKMLEQLNLAKEGMINEGLKPTDYGAYFFKKPDNSMEFQYKHLDSIIERVNAVQEWKTRTYSNESTQTESLGDVYETKMTNLRNFIMEDTRSDWIAKDTWFIKNHLIWYLSRGILFLFDVLGIFILLIIMFLFANIKGYYDDEDDDGFYRGCGRVFQR